MRVLVVDDDPEFRVGLAAILGDHGHSVISVPSAGEAIRALEREEFEVMFTDIRMGRRSGMDLLVEVRNRWPRLSVVMLTAKGTVESAVQALQLGALDYIRKPVQPDQVLRVLELVGQQLALTVIGAPIRDPAEYARALAAEGGYEVLLISPLPAPVDPGAAISHLPLDADNPSGIAHAVEDFATPRERAAVVLTAVEEIMARHREEDVTALLEEIRAILEGKGPLAVGYDPSKITATGALAVRASIVSADAHTTLESLSSPIRRFILLRLAHGPCTFMQTMEAGHVDDTSKVAFHLRKLTESGLVVHLPKQRYRLTARGKGAVQILGSIDRLDPGKGSGNRIFLSKPTKESHA